MLNAFFALPPQNRELIYGPELEAQISKEFNLLSNPVPWPFEDCSAWREALAEADVLFSGWGAPVFNERFLSMSPGLKAVFYGAGSVRGCVTPAFWARNIPITSSYAANAIPVAEFAFAQIILSLKKMWQNAELASQRRPSERVPCPGCFDSTVGIVSLGMIGAHVCQLLKSLDLKVIAHDPFLSEERFKALNAEAVSLEALFERSDVISLHLPWTPDTEGMIDRSLLSRLKEGATVINTARGAVVNQPDLIATLQERPDLFALLDVTDPEPPEDDSALFDLPNLVLTPHIAGSMDSECLRMGQYALDEARRFLRGEPLKWLMTAEKVERMT